MLVKITMYNIRIDIIQWQMYYFLSDGNSNVCLLTIYEIFINQIKCKKFDLENEGQGHDGEKRD